MTLLYSMCFSYKLLQLCGLNLSLTINNSIECFCVYCQLQEFMKFGCVKVSCKTAAKSWQIIGLFFLRFFFLPISHHHQFYQLWDFYVCENVELVENLRRCSQLFLQVSTFHSKVACSLIDIIFLQISMSNFTTLFCM